MWKHISALNLTLFSRTERRPTRRFVLLAVNSDVISGQRELRFTSAFILLFHRLNRKTTHPQKSRDLVAKLSDSSGFIQSSAHCSFARSLGWRRRLAAAMMTVRMLVVMVKLRWRRGLQIPPPATLTPRWTLQCVCLTGLLHTPKLSHAFWLSLCPPRANCPLIGLSWLHLGTGAAIPALFIPPPCLHFARGRGKEFRQHEYDFMNCSRQNDP